jgi:hypothetical protein
LDTTSFQIGENRPSGCHCAARCNVIITLLHFAFSSLGLLFLLDDLLRGQRVLLDGVGRLQLLLVKLLDARHELVVLSLGRDVLKS